MVSKAEAKVRKVYFDSLGQARGPKDAARSIIMDAEVIGKEIGESAGTVRRIIRRRFGWL